MTRSNIVACLLGSLLAVPGLAQEASVDRAGSTEELQRQIDTLSEQLEALQEQVDARRQEAETGDPASAGSASSSTTGVDEARSNETKGNEAASTPIRTGQLIAAEGREDPYVDKQFKKSVPLFGSDWRFSFGGYAKADLIHDFSGTGDKDQFVLATIPVDGSPPPGSYSNLHIRETRFNFETRNTGSQRPKDRFFLEMDFFGSGGSSEPRLRHAYFQYGNLLAGRTWTLLTELRALPLILDFAAGDSLLGGRTEQIRWSQANEARDFGWSVAIENFDDGEVFNPTNRPGTARSNFPRLATGFTKIWPGLTWSLGGAITQIRWDGTGTVDDSSEVGYTVVTGGRVFLGNDKKNYVGYSLGYASGSITDIIAYANGGVPNAAVDADGNIQLAKGWVTQIGLHWIWTDKWSSNFSVAYADLTDVPQPFDPDFIKTPVAVHANLIYKFDERITGGLEFMDGERTNVSDRDGDAQRLQFSLFYYF